MMSAGYCIVHVNGLDRLCCRRDLLLSPTLLYFSGNTMTTTTTTTYYAPLIAPSEASRYANPLRTMLVVVPEQADPDEPTKLVQAAIKAYGGRAIGLMHLDVPKIIRTDMDLVKVISGLPQKANYNSTETNWTVVFRHSRNEKWTWFITKWMRAGGCARFWYFSGPSGRVGQGYAIKRTCTSRQTYLVKSCLSSVLRCLRERQYAIHDARRVKVPSRLRYVNV
ncbi:hypothetical protein G7K_1181-t1 [Saitoella complicata NRRL Y-17804]|uniref:Uncharacterized protein n=1 Tax=Saitoella complicata (strain BCRC 22490 / CBS 7301 / JCM 7358 / NBRC 10748 / NRRL Y-17804) TaxID=698492 RepID=A0A0E9NAW4_SAICN|nr:hypothetical protein G7K_1181-t1 [Saitoella complicata NRRL Y-17804]